MRARWYAACAGTLASAGQIRVNQSLAGAPEAFRNATINLNRPGREGRGPSYVFAAGSQVCIPNFFGPGPAAPAAAAPQAAAAQGEHAPLGALNMLLVDCVYEGHLAVSSGGQPDVPPLKSFEANIAFASGSSC